MRPIASQHRIAGLVLGAGLALSAPTSSQGEVHATVGPSPAPIGSPIWITVSNDKPFLGSTGSCPFTIFDASDQVVFDPSCADNAILMGPYGWLTFEWDQRDTAGQQVAPGHYRVEVEFDVGPPKSYAVLIGGTDAGLVFGGAAALGTIDSPVIFEPRHFFLSAPQQGGEFYWLLASATATSGIATCGGVFPLDPGALLDVSLGGGLFGSALGVLGPNGTTEGPTFEIPNSPSLLGLSIETAFAVLDLDAPCPVASVSAPYRMTFVE